MTIYFFLIQRIYINKICSNMEYFTDSQIQFLDNLNLQYKLLPIYIYKYWSKVAYFNIGEQHWVCDSNKSIIINQKKDHRWMLNSY